MGEDQRAPAAVMPPRRGIIADERHPGYYDDALVGMPPIEKEASERQIGRQRNSRSPSFDVQVTLI